MEFLLGLIITLIAAVGCTIVTILSFNKEEVWNEIYKHMNL